MMKRFGTFLLAFVMVLSMVLGALPGASAATAGQTLYLKECV